MGSIIPYLTQPTRCFFWLLKCGGTWAIRGWEHIWAGRGEAKSFGIIVGSTTHLLAMPMKPEVVTVHCPSWDFGSRFATPNQASHNESWISKIPKYSGENRPFFLLFFLRPVRHPVYIAPPFWNIEGFTLSQAYASAWCAFFWVQWFDHQVLMSGDLASAGSLVYVSHTTWMIPGGLGING